MPPRLDPGPPRAWTEALDCARRAREILTELGPSIPSAQRRTLLLDALTLHGVALRQLGRYSYAEDPLQRAVRLATRSAAQVLTITLTDLCGAAI